MAEELLRKELDSDESVKGKISVSSAGIAAIDGDRASRNSVLVLKEVYSINMDHCAKKLSLEMLEESDIVLTMSTSHSTIILNSFPKMSNKVFTLKQYVYGDLDLSRNMDIADPFMGDETVYKKCCKEIKDAVDKLLIKFKTTL